MATPIVIVAQGGLPITEAANGFGMPVVIVTNGFGIPATIVASGGTPVVGSGGGTPVGGLLSLTVANTTPIDPQSSVGASGSGWVAIATLKGLTSLVGTAVPNALTLSVTDPGFDAAGNVTTVARTITGVAHLRRQYPNGNSKMISTDGTNLTLYITLDDWIYSGTTIVSASIGATFYPGCVAGNAASKLNLSATAYTKPLFGWINPQQDLAGATANVECVAFHRHATGGRQAACIKFTATDGTTTSPVVTVAATALSSRITQGNIPEVWKAALDMSSLAQATMCTVNAKVYPWLGDASSVLDLSVDGAAWPTALAQTQLRVFNDRTGGYGGAFAYVQNGASGGTVSITAATARAAPFPTIEAALNAITAFNNANKGHNDFGGGTVRVMDSGVATTITINGAPGNAFGATWLNIEKDPAATFSVTITWGSQQQWPQMVRWRGGLIIANTGPRTFLGNDEANGLFCWDGITIGTGVEITWHAIKYLYNVTATGKPSSLNGFPGTTYAIASAMGIVIPQGVNPQASDVSSLSNALVMVGNQLPDTGVSNTSASYGDDGRIFYNNRFYFCIMTSNNAVVANTKGLANVQNLYETDAVPNNIAMNFFADGDVTTISNYIDFHNTAIGERCSRMYNDVAGTMTAPNGCVKMGVSKYTVIDDYNIKSDTHIQAGGFGAPGNWAFSYSVGNAGNVSLYGSKGGALPTNDNSDNFMGNAWLPSSEPSLIADLGMTTTAIMALFTNYTVGPQATPARGGNYQPINTAAVLKSRVPAGKSILQFDIAGNLRKTDGTGAAGAYEAAP
jgi:hypothetical protein